MTDQNIRTHLREARQICELASAGDLEARVRVDTEDPEVRSLAHAINRVLDVADAFVRETAAAMDHCARDEFHRPILLRGFRGAYRKSASTINSAAIKMRENANYIAGTAKQASELSMNVSVVATASEELSATSADIRGETSRASDLTAQAVRDAMDLRTAMADVAAAAGKVESIVGAIHRIAAQTNLLALNATIEAARAGENGRGFGVVANEVKELSRSSAKATEDIQGHIDAMQKSVADALTSIQQISSSIALVNERTAAIAHALDGQVQATEDIARNISVLSQQNHSLAARFAR